MASTRTWYCRRCNDDRIYEVPSYAKTVICGCGSYMRLLDEIRSPLMVVTHGD